MKQAQDHIDWTLVYAILAGEADEQQEAQWRELFLTQERYRNLYEELKPSFLAAEADPRTVQRLQFISRLHETPTPAPAKVKRFPYWQAAAILFVCCGIAAYLSGLKPMPAPQTVTWQQIKAGTGRLTTVTFPEGSTVRLSPLSTIRFPNQFAGGLREVYLHGEGYFSVKKNNDPFLVHAGDITTRVLGTAFSINANDNKEVCVSLVEGKVQVLKESADTAQSLAVLIPNQSLRYQAKDDSWEVKRFTAQEAAVIKNGGIVFKATPLKEVAGLLENYYDVKVVFQDAQLQQLRFSSMFSKPSLREILQAVRVANKVDYIIRDSVIYLKKKI
ncbi:FecR domain-containing protein [Chitinophaga sedimenti]|uniref:FecR family protein n=1 Tax=Chitinophaga sedimenti TaxID=2033606 RepID=UPI00200444C2|nr:FecR domain-containing protein [Chitinophaga sedimenti]MCK7557843.1 FecR domain-containing protein [Chitinophaga sedimenti]